MHTLFLFQRELSLLKHQYLSSSDEDIKTQIQREIVLLTAAIKEIKENMGTKYSLNSAKHMQIQERAIS